MGQELPRSSCVFTVPSSASGKGLLTPMEKAQTDARTGKESFSDLKSPGLDVCGS